jgi:hypothetical protein
MSEELSDRNFLWLWTWVLVAVSSAGYVLVSLISFTPRRAEGMLGVLRFLVEVALPIGMCALASWFAFEEWRSGRNSA